MTPPVRVATRGSRLALRQVALVAELLGIAVDPVVVSTVGDRSDDVPLRAIAGQGAFTGDVRAALASGAADLAVHSAKDLPAEDDPHFHTAYAERADARDVLVGCTLAQLPRRGIVATGAPRRRAQLAALRRGLRFADLRGNIDTRLRKARDFDAIVVAAAALQRLDIVPDVPTQVLPVDQMTPQVGQGVLAVDGRCDDPAARELLDRIDHAATRLAITAERSFLATLGGDCDLPAGAHATVDDDGTIELRAVLADARGHLVRDQVSSIDPEEAGASAAHLLRPRLEGAHESAGARQ